VIARVFRARPGAATLVGVLSILAWLGLAAGPHPVAAGQAATPSADPCAAASPAAGADHAGMGHGAMVMGEMEFDRMYIDMMIPHHASIVAMSQAALTRLDDERLREIAQRIIDTQSAEIEELRGLRARFYGDAEPMPMDGPLMGMMGQMMPGMGSPEEMAAQMDPAAQVAALCAAENADLAFIDLTIPHHESAIAASEAALDQATHDEIRVFAERVIADQRREIDELTAIRAELSGPASPVAGAGVQASAGGHDHDAANAGAATERAIRALSPDEVAQIARGEGAGFALPAERNGVPGPRHALDLAADLALSGEQRARLQTVFDAMRAAAIPAGQRYLDAQYALETALRDGGLTTERLRDLVAEVNRLEGELAVVHLAAHLETAAILTPEQIDAYNRLRGAE
jgi:uncharacterized protein (DUF305 family)/Spy/CpxP family protein refolding chaperone